MITGRRGCCKRWKSGLVATILVLALAGSVGPAGFAGRAAGGEPADGPLPEVTPAQLAARIREAMSRYDDRGILRVVFTDTQDISPPSADRWEPFGRRKPHMVSYRGRARYEGDGTRWRVEYDSMTANLGSTRLNPDRWISGFDGVRPYWLVAKSQVYFGESSPDARQWSPRSIIWESGDELVRMLELADGERLSIAIARRTIDGTRCYVVESKTPEGERDVEAFISPRQGYLAIGRKRTFHGATYSSRSLQGVHEVLPGIWAPARIEDEASAASITGASRFEMRRRIQVVEYRPGRIPPESAFRVEIPYGIDRIDREAGSSYYNDPWWPEVGAMLREKFGWPPQDFSPLWHLPSYSQRELEGQPAPPLRVTRWLNTKPIDLVTLRGKVVLIEFGNVRDQNEPRYAPALRALYAAYHPAGLEILSIHPPEADAEELRRFARDYRLPYPVVIDEGPPGTSGVTARAFAIQDRICAFLIDHEGRIRRVRNPSAAHSQVIGTIVSLLKKSGARDVEPVSVETPRLGDDAYKAADRLFRTEVKRALDARPTGKITGRIVDENRRPISDVSVRAQLQLMVMTSTTPGAWFNIRYRAPDDRFVARSGADGRFELSGLCKGGHILTVESPGRAWAERKVFLAPDLQPASVEFVLNQGDAIAGQVRDKQGKPIAHAQVIPTYRQHFEGGELHHRDDMRHLRVFADDEGRFRFDNLEQGHYIIEVKAGGFKDRELDLVPAGKEVEVTLERSP